MSFRFCCFPPFILPERPEKVCDVSLDDKIEGGLAFIPKSEESLTNTLLRCEFGDTIDPLSFRDRGGMGGLPSLGEVGLLSSKFTMGLPGLPAAE